MKSRTHAVAGASNDENYSSDDEYLDSVTVKLKTISAVLSQKMPKEIYANMLIQGKPDKFHVDCGATVNIWPAKYLENADIKLTERVLQMWNKTELKPEGTCHLTIRNPKNNHKYSIEFMIVRDRNLMPLLRAKVIQHMVLADIHKETFEQVYSTKVRKNVETPTSNTAKELIIEYNDVFTGELGTLAGEQHLEVDPAVLPTVSPSRRVPFALKPKLKAEQDRLTDIGHTSMYYTEMQRERRETQQEEAEALVQADHTPRASDNIEGTKSRPIENRSGAEHSKARQSQSSTNILRVRELLGKVPATPCRSYGTNTTSDWYGHKLAVEALARCRLQQNQRDGYHSATTEVLQSTGGADVQCDASEKVLLAALVTKRTTRSVCK